MKKRVPPRRAILTGMNSDDFLDAIRRGDAVRVRDLIDRDASLLRRGEGASPILLALYSGQREIARLLADRTPDRTLHEAAALGESDRVRQMLQADRGRIAEYSSDGYALLGFGTFFGHPDVDRVVLEFEPDVNAQARNAQRVGAVHAAAAVQDHDMLRTLLERGADPNARQQSDYTPLHTAAARGDVEMAKLLLAHGADRSARGSDGKSVADVAREHGHEAFLQWFGG
jgi:ankyrin repeat protein